ncbi:hypothetical protein DOTSEDRAFT_68980 [Dothistroma septosporum NZE10]|uniref:Uncharacterized protein n=1 Tax=Dothistroma septosporum (strain NZE10 / CBS 128990) TaxID=675120 RepID=N1Q5G3_DOTSN|nr:hypothetical protein DOTSEDRAFT_68980 [Dothistroma septosporum NZE10]
MFVSTNTFAHCIPGSHGSAGQVLLACAILRSRQLMTTEVAFTAHVKRKADLTALNIDSNIKEHDILGNLVTQIDSPASRHADTILHGDQGAANGTHDHDVTLTLTHGRWTIEGEFAVSHALPFEQTFRHVYQ